MKPLRSAFVVGIGFSMLWGSPARAQVGGMGETLNQGADDAARREVMKGAAEKAGLPAPAAPAAAPGADADTDAADAPMGEPNAASGVGKNPPKLP